MESRPKPIVVASAEFADTWGRMLSAGVTRATLDNIAAQYVQQRGQEESEAWRLNDAYTARQLTMDMAQRAAELHRDRAATDDYTGTGAVKFVSVAQALQRAKVTMPEDQRGQLNLDGLTGWLLAETVWTPSKADRDIYDDGATVYSSKGVLLTPDGQLVRFHMHGNGADKDGNSRQYAGLSLLRANPQDIDVYNEYGRTYTKGDGKQYLAELGTDDQIQPVLYDLIMGRA